MEEVDPFEAQAMIHILSSRPSEIINYETLERVNSFKRHKLCMVALRDIEKRFFFMIKPEQVNQGVIDALNTWRVELIKDDDRLGFMLKHMLPDVNIIVNLKRFTVSLIGFIERIKNKTHNAFRDFEAFEKASLPFPDDSELELVEASFQGYVYGDFSKARSTYIKLKTSLSPERLIGGFSAQDKVVIDPVDRFVYKCFSFNSNYDVPAEADDFSFRPLPRTKHSMTDLICEMKRKKWISATNDEIFQFLSQLIPGFSAHSFKVYSSPTKRISSKFRIDIQLFNPIS